MSSENRENPEAITVYVSVGNSDNKLSQGAWSDFLHDYAVTVRDLAIQVYGDWHSLPNAPYQNACIAASIPVSVVDQLRAELTEVRKAYCQDSIAWAICSGTEFI